MSEEVKKKRYDPENCPCPRGAQGVCPRYKDCEACRAFHREKGEGSRTACERLYGE